MSARVFTANHRYNLAEAQRVRNERLRAERLEDVLWLAETGESLTGAAKRLDLTHQALDHWTRRHAPEARAKMLAREPIGYSEWRRVS